ncbi:MAG: peptidoglycan DD-metalloendopeptidase family protein [Lachnospiraceae bacterium]|jgi:septal ring factor EnvC (AmiA/AmiB activator)|nr:peptidoglycan DD-metalloendopeptidase family protein [Lachnospiraceae bacterium]
MGRSRHKRRNSHVVIVTSDAADARMKQFRIRPWIVQTIVIILCVLVGALIGYFLYENNVRTGEVKQTEAQNEAISILEQEKADLEAQVAGLNEEIGELNEQIRILSETVSQKVQSEGELSGQLEQQYLPTRLPLSERATMDGVTGEDLTLVFTASSGAMVVATASGTVIGVNDDTEYGHNVWIDHGNGYVTVYRNQGEVKVKQGETVTRGATLFLITEDSSKLGYQVRKDDVYVDPMDMLDISG